MAFDELMGLTNRLLANALALSAVAARLKLDELGETGDPALREQLDRVLDELGVGDQVAAVTDDLMTVRSRGSVVDAARAADLLQHAGFEDVREIDRTWNPPLRFVVGSRA